MRRMLMVGMLTGGLAAGLAAGLAGCDDGNDVDGQTKDLIEDQQAAWTQGHSSYYRYTYERHCYCDALGPVSITVENDAVTEAFVVATGVYLEGSDLAAMPTIDDLYALMTDAIDSGADEITALGNADAEPGFDSTYHYPTSVWIDYAENVADDEVGFLAGDYAPFMTQ